MRNRRWRRSTAGSPATRSAPRRRSSSASGPGLTPSGDDYLGGVLVALRWVGRGAQADSLWRWLEPRLAAGTSAISAAHLAAAAGGEAHEALHEVLRDLSAWEAPDLLPACAARRVGHTSGWDALAGIVAVARTSQ